MRIGKLKLTTAAPDAERLLASTGLSRAEMRAQLGGYPIAGVVAAALNACLAEPMPTGELAMAIAAAGLEPVRVRVADLYEAAEGVPDGEAAKA
jgi:hypothetical protein